MNGNRLYRSTSEAMIGGVAAGLGNYFKVDPTIVRAIFIIVTFFTGGAFILAYLAMWLLIPTAGSTATNPGAVMQENLDEIGAKMHRKWGGSGAAPTNGSPNSGPTGSPATNGNPATGGPVSGGSGAPSTPNTPGTPGTSMQMGTYPRHGILPLVLICVGVFFLFGHIGFFHLLWVGFWPLVLIGLGLLLLSRRRNRW